MRNLSLQKYLRSHSDVSHDILQTLEELPSKLSHICVVPIKNESEEFWKSLETWLRLRSKAEALFILVINARQTDSRACLAANQALVEKLLSRSDSANSKLREGQYSYCFKIQATNFCVLHHSQQGFFFKEKQGVGLARKIGFDLACQLFATGRMQGSWIHSSDADARLPDDYFLRVSESNAQEFSAALYPFFHLTDGLGDYKEALRFYDYSIRYYADQLKWARSPFAYVSLGSCLAIPVQAYAQVRGFPNREAGEDFYILNKLRKIGPIQELVGQPIELQGRLRTEVLFGTTQSTLKIGDQLKKGCLPELYDPRCFAELKELLTAFRDSQLERLSERTRFVLQKQGHWAELLKIQEQEREPRRSQRFLEFFDALKSLRFVHEMTREFYPKQALKSPRQPQLVQL
ncbi:MAG: hypothetical protein EA369_01300 [Bradymonadales bacterium]|nr:MAG: hypothetical protein EA369_01300 [Bradymonadales bacterium]